MEGHGVLGLLVHAFDDIDLSVVGPVRTHGPAVAFLSEFETAVYIGDKKNLNSQRWPSSTNRAGHMLKVQDDQAMCVCVGTSQADAFPAAAGRHIVVVNTDIGSTARSSREKSIILSRVLVYIFNVTMCWIRGLLRIDQQSE
jgi:hypothetical protein